MPEMLCHGQTLSFQCPLRESCGRYREKAGAIYFMILPYDYKTKGCEYHKKKIGADTDNQTAEDGL